MGGEEIRQGPETASIDLAAEARGVRITLDGRLWAHSADPWDRAALGATITLHDGTPEVPALAVLWAPEFGGLRGYLAALSVPGRAPRGVWASLDGTLVLGLTVPGPQEGWLTVTVQDTETGWSLQVVIGASPAAVAGWLAPIDSVLARYPAQVRHLDLETVPVPRDDVRAG